MRARFWAHFGTIGCFFLLLLTIGCGAGAKSAINSVAPTTTVALSGTSFDFGQNIVNNPVGQTVVTVSNTGGIPLTLSPVVTGDGSYAIVAGQSCGGTLAPGASCPMIVSYTPTVAGSQKAVLNLNFGDAPVLAPALVTLTGTSAAMAAGTVTATANPQVAQYTITPPFAGNVTINFGTTTQYGLQTWAVPTPSGGGAVSIYVAGMLANTAYHLQAAVQLGNGVTVNDVDNTFTTTSYAASLVPHFTATTTAGQTPQPGIELLNPIIGPAAEVAATDLQGKVIWQYVPADSLAGATITAPKLLSNGDMIAVIAPSGSSILVSHPAPGTANLVREFDLAGNTVKQLTMDQLNTKLAAANYNLTLQVFHHDVTVLPNGHWLVLTNTLKNVVLNGQTTPTQVLGDVIVDLDTNLNVVWVWNEFDHLDVNRRGANFPDWTHTNAIVYSKDDGNLLVSLRHQSWVVKVDYNNGTGAGDILWRLGQGGDFQLVGGTDPTDWFYGQHAPSFTTSNTTGIFGLTLMDNGDFRIFPAGVTCGVGSAPVCHYTTVPYLTINETAKTATLGFKQTEPANLYSFFGGSADALANGDLEFDLAGLPGPQGQVFEVTTQGTPQTVWNLVASPNYIYRAYRLPSLYPGVQW